MKKVQLDGKEFWARVIFEKQEKSNIFREEHASGLGGHGGKNKCIAKIREKYFWPNMYKDIENWVKILCYQNNVNLL